MKTVLKTFPLKSVQPNPFRNMKVYPINEEKVRELIASYGSTDWWANVVARIDDKGRPEIAYGHHRIEALRRWKDAPKEISLLVADIDNATMLRMMANENSKEYGHTAAIDIETVRAVVIAHAEGQITLNPPAKNAAYLRYAPLFIIGVKEVKSQQHNRVLQAAAGRTPYTSREVSDFLGWTTEARESSGWARAANALRALEQEQQGIVDLEDVGCLPVTTAFAVTEQVAVIRKKLMREREEMLPAVKAGRIPEHAVMTEKQIDNSVRNAAKKVVSHIKHEEKEGRTHGENAARDFMRSQFRTSKGLPDVNTFARQITKRLKDIAEEILPTEKLDDLAKFAEAIDPMFREDLIDALLGLEKVARTGRKYAEQIKTNGKRTTQEVRDVTPKQKFLASK